MRSRSPSLLVIGWSARAAAQSARRGGYDVTAIDVFQDADLLLAATKCRCVRTLRELVTATADLPPCDWLYTGGLENQPAVVTAIAKRHRLLGNDAGVLRRVRDPRLLQRALIDGPAPMPEMRWTAPGHGDDRQWLVKRRSSGGGVRVLRYDGKRTVPRGAYLQEFASGIPCGASYVGDGSRCRFLGLCRQTHAAVDPARPFLYGGSIGPICVGINQMTSLVQLGERLVAEFDLRGLFGVDVILQRDGSLRTLEVNPRYTASMELLERASGRSFMELHAQACLEHRLPESFPTKTTFHGKRILYVDDATPGSVSPQLAAILLTRTGESDHPPIADLPAAGTQPHCGEPFCTIFADGATENLVERDLKRRESQLRAWMTERSGMSPMLQQCGRH